MDIGNRYQYQEPPPEGIFDEVRVFGDTLMSNGKSYRVFRSIGGGAPLYYTFFRTDSNRIYEYNRWADREILRYDFSKTIGDTVSVFPVSSPFQDTATIRVIGEGIVNLFGKSTLYKTFYETRRSSLYWIHQIADSVGLIFYQFEPGVQLYLTGAVIAGKSHGTITRVEDVKENVLRDFMLFQNYPNPFNPVTKISFHVPERNYVELILYSVLGKEVRTLYRGIVSAGQVYTFFWDGKNDFSEPMPSGVYFYRLRTASFNATRKMILLR